MAFEHVYNGMVKRAGGSAWDAFTEKLKDPEFLKNIGMGLGAAGLTGLGTYALSGLIPGAKKERGLRLLASILAGTGVGSAVSYYGKDIRDYLSNYFGSKNDPATAPQIKDKAVTTASVPQVSDKKTEESKAPPSYSNTVARIGGGGAAGAGISAARTANKMRIAANRPKLVSGNLLPTSVTPTTTLEFSPMSTRKVLPPSLYSPWKRFLAFDRGNTLKGGIIGAGIGAGVDLADRYLR